MRVVGIAIVTALLSAGCALQAGDPGSEEVQRPTELVGSGTTSQPGVNARPQVLTRNVLGQPGPNADSPNPSPWTDQGSGDPHAGNVNGDPSDNGGNGGTGGQTDNPNPSPWDNPSGSSHLGGIGKGGTGG